MEAPPPNYAEYPRQAIEPRIRFETFGEAWKFLLAAPGQWMLATFLMLLIAILCGAPFYILAMMQMLGKANPSIEDIFAFYALSIPALLMLYVGHAIAFAGMYHMALKQIQGNAISIKDMFSLGGSSVFAHIAAGLMISIGVVIGSIACYLPGFIVGGLLMFAQPMLVHQKMSPWQALTSSWHLLKKQVWMAMAFYLVISIIAGLGGLACGIGVLFTYPLYPLAVSLIYRDYMQALYGQPQVPASELHS